MKNKISLRVSTYVWMDAQRRHELLAMLEQYRNTIDEVAFFTGFTHPPLPLAAIQERALVLSEIIPQFKALGLSTGINHLATIGHLDENLENSLNESWQHLVDISGAVSKSCYCASDPRMQTYIRQVYTVLAETQPDFIWVDDDVRMESHQPSITMACFCDLCLEKFSKQTGSTWTRSALAEILNHAPASNRMEMRRKWLEHNRDYIKNILALVRSAVDEVNPSISLGLMTGETVYSGYGFSEWAETLAGPAALPVKWRPGGGFYTDVTPREALTKAHSVGRQTALLPDKITEIQYEHENFPYQVLKKSRTIFIAESCAAIAAGCTGLALNCMGISSDPFDEYLPYFAAVQSYRPFFDQAVETFNRQPCLGLWPAFTMDHAAALNLKGDWDKAPLWGTDFGRFTELSEIGLPLAYSRSGSYVSLLTGESAAEFTQAELIDILSGGVLVDGLALVELNQRGLGEYTGFTVQATRDRDTIECFTNDPINDRFGGWKRDCRPSFWPESTFILEPLPGARPLAELYDFTPTNHGICSGVYENSLGGRVAVMGYYPWASLQSLAKTAQIKTLVRWLSHDTFPAYVESYDKVALWCRMDAQGHSDILLMNVSLDEMSEISLMVKTTADRMDITRMDGLMQVYASLSTEGAYTRFLLQDLKPWEAVIIAV